MSSKALSAAFVSNTIMALVEDSEVPGSRQFDIGNFSLARTGLVAPAFPNQLDWNQMVTFARHRYPGI